MGSIASQRSNMFVLDTMTPQRGNSNACRVALRPRQGRRSSN